MKQAPSPKLRPTVWDGLVAALVLALAIGTAVLFYGNLGHGDQLTAVITHRGETVETVVLSTLQEEQIVHIDGEYHLTITLQPDGVQVTESDCPGQDCLHTGVIRRRGQSIICLPEQVVIRLEGSGDGPDLVLG